MLWIWKCGEGDHYYDNEATYNYEGLSNDNRSLRSPPPACSALHTLFCSLLHDVEHQLQDDGLLGDVGGCTVDHWHQLIVQVIHASRCQPCSSTASLIPNLGDTIHTAILQTIQSSLSLQQETLHTKDKTMLSAIFINILDNEEVYFIKSYLKQIYQNKNY